MSLLSHPRNYTRGILKHTLQQHKTNTINYDPTFIKNHNIKCDRNKGGAENTFSSQQITVPP